MNRIIIDGNRIDSKEALFASLHEQISRDRMPGSNLDALSDYLTSLTVHTIIEIHSEAVLRETLGEYWKRVLWMLSDCLEENRDLKLEYIE